MILFRNIDIEKRKNDFKQLLENNFVQIKKFKNPYTQSIIQNFSIQFIEQE